jgi:hypothetical protein
MTTKKNPALEEDKRQFVFLGFNIPSIKSDLKIAAAAFYNKIKKPFLTTLKKKKKKKKNEDAIVLITDAEEFMIHEIKKQNNELEITHLPYIP